MNAILKQLIISVILITLLDKFLPSGKMKQIGKTALGMVMLLLLVTFFSDIVNRVTNISQGESQPMFLSQPDTVWADRREKSVDSICENLSAVAKLTAKNAGFMCTEVWITLSDDGTIEQCIVELDQNDNGYSGNVPEDLKQLLAVTLQIAQDKIIAFKEA